MGRESDTLDRAAGGVGPTYVDGAPVGRELLATSDELDRRLRWDDEYLGRLAPRTVFTTRAWRGGRVVLRCVEPCAERGMLDVTAVVRLVPTSRPAWSTRCVAVDGSTYDNVCIAWPNAACVSHGGGG
ncbi:MAG: hypothetical protein K0V04_18590 [Deltaproteobacteria bacterium]|nr:hypothetical protein [Deltaproteobacteria bacterium]